MADLKARTAVSSSGTQRLARLPSARLVAPGNVPGARQSSSARALSPGGQTPTSGNTSTTGLTAEGIKVSSNASAAPRRMDASPSRPNTLAQVNRSFLALEMELEREEAMRAAAYQALVTERAETIAAGGSVAPAISRSTTGANAPFVLNKVPQAASAAGATGATADNAARDAMKAVVPTAKQLRNALRAAYRPVDQVWNSGQQQQPLHKSSKACAEETKKPVTISAA